MNAKRTILNNSRISGFADEISPNMDTQISLLNELGISFIEFRSAEGINVADHTLEQAKELKKKLDAGRIQVSAIGSPIGKINITDDFAPHLQRLEHVLNIAEILGTRYIRMFSFFMPNNEDPAPYRDEVFRRTESMVKAAARRNMVLLHENEKDIYGDIPTRCLELMKRFYSDHYRCTFDFANFVQCDQDPLAAYEILAPYISYVHIKDSRSDNHMVVPAGEGDGRIKEVLTLLDKAGYEGFLSLEPHLTDFAGLKDLEKDVQIRGRSDGESAFCQAHMALLKLLK